MVVVGLIAIWFVWDLARTRESIPDDAQVVLEIERDGPRVQSDAQLIERLSGSGDVTDRAALAAFCVNGWYAATDVTLNLDVVVASDPRLVRAADLASSREFDPQLVAAVEGDLLASSSEPAIEHLTSRTVAQFGAEVLEQYLAASALPSAPDAARRYIVYAASRTVSKQLLYFIDLERLDMSAIRRFMDEQMIDADEAVVIAGRSDTVKVDRSDCNELAGPG